MTAQRIQELEQLVHRLDAQLNLCREQTRNLKTEVTVASNNSKHWRRRFEMVRKASPYTLMLDLDPHIFAELHREATMRSQKPDQLAKKIVETVVKDKLFSNPRRTPMSKLANDHATILKEQTARIHAAVNDGTLDRETVNDALWKLNAMADDETPTAKTAENLTSAQKGEKAHASHASR